MPLPLIAGGIGALVGGAVGLVSAVAILPFLGEKPTLGRALEVLGGFSLAAIFAPFIEPVVALALATRKGRAALGYRPPTLKGVVAMTTAGVVGGFITGASLGVAAPEGLAAFGAGTAIAIGAAAGAAGGAPAAVSAKMVENGFDHRPVMEGTGKAAVVGGVGGAIGGGVAGALSVPAATAASPLLRTSASALTGPSAGATAGAGMQATANLLDDRPVTENVDHASVAGAFVGTVAQLGVHGLSVAQAPRDAPPKIGFVQALVGERGSNDPPSGSDLASGEAAAPEDDVARPAPRGGARIRAPPSARPTQPREVETPLASYPSPKIYTAGGADPHDALLVAAEISKVPPKLLAILDDYGTKVIVCRGSVTDYRPDLAGVRPRGWSPGSTWDRVPALYDPNRNEIVVATDGRRVLNAGSINAPDHEATHAIDAALQAKGRGGSDDPSFVRARKADLVTLSSYERQPGAAGREETFAEQLARYLNHADDRPNLRRYWDQRFGDAGDIADVADAGPSLFRRLLDSARGLFARRSSDTSGETTKDASPRLSTTDPFLDETPSQTVDEFVSGLVDGKTSQEIFDLQRLPVDKLAKVLYKQYHATDATKPSAMTQADYDAALDQIKGGSVRELDAPSWRVWDNGLSRSWPSSARRIYMNVSPEGGAQVARELASALDRQGITFQEKLPSSTQFFTRSDTLVVYMNARDYPAVALALEPIARAHPEAFFEGTPAFTRAIGRGIAMSADPTLSDNLSFGQKVTNAIAAGIQLAGPGASPAKIVSTVDQVMQQHFHIDPRAPYLLGR